MGEWEKELLSKSNDKPFQYWRYVDDIWGLWTHGEQKLHEFVNTANNIHKRIKLELRFSTTSIEFLDLSISLNNGFFKTNLYSKETDKHQYLHITSNHPRKVKESIPYGLGIRLKRICSEETDYENRKTDLKGHLLKRGYNSKLIDNQLEKVDKLNREDLLQYNQPKNSDRVPLVLTYTDALPNIHSILYRHMNTLHHSDEMKEIFPKPPIVAFRRDKSLKDILVHKKHNNMFYKKPNKCEPCGKKCALCKFIISGENFLRNRRN